MLKQELIFRTQDLTDVVKKVINGNKDIKVITLQGTLGAGKTTFAIELMRQLGVYTEMQSPTYTYVQMYANSMNKKFYHFDLYRLSHQNDFLFAGFDEFLYQPDSLVIIEWPEIVESLLSHDVCVIQLDYIDDVTRKISWFYR